MVEWAGDLHIGGSGRSLVAYAGGRCVVAMKGGGVGVSHGAAVISGSGPTPSDGLRQC